VNGQRFALNPTPYQSESNFFNFATIPTVAIERVDVLTDGASAIYGSDAIAGVINVILRKEFDSQEMTVTAGNTTRGGGRSTKLTGGNSFQSHGALLTLGYQWEKRDPIYASERAWLGEIEPDSIPLSIALFDYSQNQYVLPNPQACDPHPSDLVTTNLGSFCTNGVRREESLRNARETWSLFSYAEKDAGLGKWFANLVYWSSETKARNFPLFWNGFFVDGTNTITHFAVREFSAEETGNQDKAFDESTYSVIGGYEGVAQSFDYRFTLSYSTYDSLRTNPLFVDAAINSFFNQPEDIFNRYQPSDFVNVMGESISDARSNSKTLSYWMSGQGFSINEQASEYALIFEWNATEYQINVDPTSANFEWFGFGGSSGRGDRNRVALGVEWWMPIIRHSSIGQLDATVALRWDDYRDDSNVGSATTWKRALQWKPNDQVSVNWVYSTSFRAPDLHYLFADNTLYFIDVFDIEQCMSDGNSYDNCRSNTNYLTNISTLWRGSTDLVEEEGTTQTAGLLFKPNENVTVSFDAYDIKLKNQVGLQLESQYLLWEAQCRRGINFMTNEPVDPNSAVCQDVLSRVFRTSFGVYGLMNTPVNRAFRRQKGIELGFEWLYATDTFGSYGLNIKHSQILKTEIQELASEPSTYNSQYKDDPFNGEINKRTNISLSWSSKDWSSVLTFYRKGSKVAFDGDSKLKPWTITNLIIKKEIDQDQELSLIVRNLFDKKPPIDPSRVDWPYFDRSQYDAIGTEWFVDYKLRY
jgi:outer membrane receptor protein involved in Fe transport